MNKIFIIGFNKTATRSLNKFFKENGLSTVHWDYENLVNTFEKNIKENKKLLTGKYENIKVFSDMTKTSENKDAKDYYKILDQQYHNSKFILNIRNVEDWIKSRKNQYNLLNRHKIYFGCDNDEIIFQKWRDMFYAHYNDVLDYFKDRPNDLLIFDIDNDKIDKIINFFKDDYNLKAEFYIKIK